MADVVLLPIDSRLLALRDVTVVPGSHPPLLHANAMIGAVQARGLRVGHLAFPDFVVDTGVLVAQAVVDLLAARVVRLPGGVGHGRGREARQRYGGGDGSEYGADRFGHKKAPLGTIAGVALRPIRGLLGVNNVAGGGAAYENYQKLPSWPYLCTIRGCSNPALILHRSVG